MSGLLLQVLMIGLVAAVVPIPILVVLVILAGAGGLTQAWWFVVGFAGSLLAAGAVALVVADQAGASIAPAAMSAIGMTIGIGFLIMAILLVIRTRRTAGSFEVTFNDLSRGRVVVLGVVAGAFNPKTLPIFLTGIAAIAVAGGSTPSRSLALILLTTAASVGVAAPPLLCTVAPGPGVELLLERTRRAIEPRATIIAIVLLLVIGLAYVVFAVAYFR